MSALGAGSRKQTRTQIKNALTDAKRRRLLTLLLERGRMTEAALADALEAADVWALPAGSGREATVTIRTEMQHVHLPKLADAGLVSWNRSEGTVTAAPSAQNDSLIRDVLEVADEDEHWDDLLSAVADERRRLVLAVLTAENGQLARDDLAGKVAAREADGGPSTETVETLQIQLHHVHLPALDDAGLVTYDPETGTVSKEGFPEQLPRLLDVLSDASRPE